MVVEFCYFQSGNFAVVRRECHFVRYCQVNRFEDVVRAKISSKSLINSNGVNLFCFQRNKNYIDLTVSAHRRYSSLALKVSYLVKHRVLYAQSSAHFYPRECVPQGQAMRFRARQSVVVRSGHVGNTLYRRHGYGGIPIPCN